MESLRRKLNTFTSVTGLGQSRTDSEECLSNSISVGAVPPPMSAASHPLDVKRMPATIALAKFLRRVGKTVACTTTFASRTKVYLSLLLISLLPVHRHNLTSGKLNSSTKQLCKDIAAALLVRLAAIIASTSILA